MRIDLPVEPGLLLLDRSRHRAPDRIRTQGADREAGGDPDLDPGLPAVERAGGELAVHRGGDHLRALTGHILAADRLPGRGQRGEVGRRLGPVPGHDRAPQVQAEHQRRGEHRDAGDRPHRGQAGVGRPGLRRGHGRTDPGSGAATARPPTRTGSGASGSVETSATSGSSATPPVRVSRAPVGASAAAILPAAIGFAAGGQPGELPRGVGAPDGRGDRDDRPDRQREEHHQAAERECGLDGDRAPVVPDGRAPSPAPVRRPPVHQNVAVSARWTSWVSASTTGWPLITT